MCVYFQALQNFGTSHVLDMYLMGLSSHVCVFISRLSRTLAPVTCPGHVSDGSVVSRVCVYFQALQNFGTSHVLDMYLMGLSSQCVCLFAGSPELWHQSRVGHVSDGSVVSMCVFISRLSRTLAPVTCWTCI